MSKVLALVLVFAAGCWTEAKLAKAPPPERHIVIKDLVQPVKVEKQERVADQNDYDGEEGGVEGGEVGGVVGGVVGGPPPPPPPPPPRTPMNVAPTMLEANRIAGNTAIVPDDKTKTEITRSQKDRVIASVKLCLADDGSVALVNLLKSSGFPDYDQKIMYTIRSSWKYSAYIVDGRPSPVCTAVTFIYAQH